MIYFNFLRKPHFLNIIIFFGRGLALMDPSFHYTTDISIKGISNECGLES